MNIILWIISALFLSFAQIYTWYKISDKNIKNFNYVTILSIIFLSLFSIINFNEINNYIKPITMIICAIIFCKLTLKEKLKNSIFIICLNYIILILTEALFGIILVSFSHSNVKSLLNTYSGGIISNTIISIIVILVCKTKIPHKVYIFIIKHTSNLKDYEGTVYLIILICCSTTGFAITYYTNNISVALFLDTIITILYSLIIFRIITTKNKLISINNKYNTSIDNLHAQEIIINDFRIVNHENKNNLLTIKGMTKSKKIIGFINSLLNKKDNVNNEIMKKIIKIPEGGIRGLIHSKMIIMQEKNINCKLNVDKIITVKTLANISDNDIVDICQILGVFIDNAIEESIKIDKKEININLHLNSEVLSIIIINYHSNVNFEIRTTKGMGHGYGLQLVKRIINNNSRLNNIREITKETYSQRLDIKI